MALTLTSLFPFPWATDTVEVIFGIDTINHCGVIITIKQRTRSGFGLVHKCPGKCQNSEKCLLIFLIKTTNAFIVKHLFINYHANFFRNGKLKHLHLLLIPFIREHFEANEQVSAIGKWGCDYEVIITICTRF